MQPILMALSHRACRSKAVYHWIKMNQLKFCLTETEECLFIIPFIKNRDVVLKASQNILDNLKSIKMLKRHLSYKI